MFKTFRALAALALIACTGNGVGNDDTSTDSGTGTVTTAETGKLLIHATYNGGAEECQANLPNGEFLGDTETEIEGLKPGDLQFTLGDPDKRSLSGEPFHIANNGDYVTGSGNATVTIGKTVEASVEMTLYPQHHCVSYECGYPYAGQAACSDTVSYAHDVWISIDAEGKFQNSNGDSTYGSVGGITPELDIDEFAVSVLDGDSEIVEASFSQDTLAFEFVLIAHAFQASAFTKCEL
ncbi:MAG: hypothetical protein WAZ14_00520 [Patescibacteria group bacterium]